MAIKLGNNDITFKVGSTDVDAIYLGSTLVYSGGTPPTPPTPSYDTEYLTFILEEDSTFKFSALGDNVINYSLDDGNTWTELASGVDTPTVSAGSKIIWKGTMTPSTSYPNYGIGKFSSSGRFIAEGSVMSLYYGDNFEGQTSLGTTYALYSLFSGCTTITSAENMVLPTILQRNCCMYMFRGCTSLTTAPVLSATTLADYCYSNMFNGCTSLNSITCLATDISASNCTYNWLKSVAANGTFTKAASMTSWTTGTSGIPNNWTVQDYAG